MECERRGLGLAHVCSVELKRHEASLSEWVSTWRVELEKQDFAKLKGLVHVVWYLKNEVLLNWQG